jgi:hypothetical protein
MLLPSFLVQIVILSNLNIEFNVNTLNDYYYYFFFFIVDYHDIGYILSKEK